MIDQRETTARHEAAHAIVAYHYGWWVNHEGVEIDERQYTGLRRRQFENTEEARVCINQAGWLAEVLWPENVGKAEPRKDEDLRSVLDDLYWDEVEFDEGSDDLDTFVTLKESLPDATDDELLAAYRVYEAKTLALLKEPKVWNAVEAVAVALCQKGKLEAEEITEILDNMDFEYSGGTF
jgi:hypothetical protein